MSGFPASLGVNPDAGSRDHNPDHSSPASPLDERDSYSHGQRLAGTPFADVEKLSHNPKTTEDALQSHGYNSSSSSSRHSDVFAGEGDYDEEMVRLTTTTSSRSSISSLPGSVVAYLPEKSDSMASSQFQRHLMQTEMRGDIIGSGSKPGGIPRFAPQVRDRDSPFRHPSSVRAMQMGDEDEDPEVLTPAKTRKQGRRVDMHSPSISGMSVRSLVSSPGSAKRPNPSPQAKSPRVPKVQKEYPLVLLHCTLLPPSLSLPTDLRPPSPRLLKEVLPERYWRRWKLLEDKIVGSGILRDRGVLISHPQEMYDLLEERLLESLELVNPRLGYGHFLGGERNVDEDQKEGRYDGDNEGSTGGCDEGEKCLDCGGRVLKRLDNGQRKWEIRVYAANGLMRAGAWAAAWKEMEKVDVEVGVCLPIEVKRELERRLIEEDNLRMEEELRLSEEEKRRREIYGEPGPSRQNIMDDLEEDEELRYLQEINHPPSTPQPRPPTIFSSAHHRAAAQEIDLQSLVVNYIRVLARDRRNVAIAFLSILVLFFAIGGARPSAVPAVSQSAEVPVLSPSVITVEHCVPSMSTVIAVETRKSPPPANLKHPPIFPLEDGTTTTDVAPTEGSPRPSSTEALTFSAPCEPGKSATTASGPKAHILPGEETQ